MTNKIVKFPDEKSSIRRDLENKCIRDGYLDEEGERYAKQIIKDIVDEYYHQVLKIEIEYPKKVDAESKESFSKYLIREVKRNQKKLYSTLVSSLVGRLIATEIIIYRLRKGLE